MKSITNPRVAVVGASGAVGLSIVKALTERSFPYSDLVLMATQRSAGETIAAGDDSITIQPTAPQLFQDIDIAFFVCGSGGSKELIPKAVEYGAVCIDKSSAYRMDPDVPLVVPEVNSRALREHSPIIASPNCSTIQLVTALKPIHDAARITRVSISSYQSVSGTGKDAVIELADQASRWARAENELGSRMPLEDALPDVDLKPEVYGAQIFGNVIPHIDDFGAADYTGEEWKMMNETKKIMGLSDLSISATCVRVPVFIGHCLTVHVQTDRKLCADSAREILAQASGISVCDDPKRCRYPMPIGSAGRDEVFVGRIREDLSQERGLILWIVADNLRKGAATNAVQIAEALLG